MRPEGEPAAREGWVFALPPEAVDALAELVEARVVQRVAGVAEPAYGEWLSVDNAARYLDISAERVRKLIAGGVMPYYQEAPNCRVFLRRKELDDWMSTYRIAPRGTSQSSRTTAETP